MRSHKLLPAVAAIVTLLVFQARGAELLKPTVVDGIGPFYGTTEGTVAYIPQAGRESAARTAGRFEVLPRSGAYRLPQADCYWFIVNHYEMPPEVTYIGVQVAKLGPSGWNPAEPVYVFRNKGWMRNLPGFKTSEFKACCGKTQPQDFVSWHGKLAAADTPEAKTTALNDMEKTFGGVHWHGLLSGTNTASWDKAVQWHKWETFNEPEFRSSFAGKLPQDYDICLDNRLLRFQTAERTYWERLTDRVLHTKQLIFDITPGPAVALYVRVFAPDRPEFEKEFYFTIGQ